MTKKVKSLDDLLQGIKQLLLENRCSFSDEEKVLLNDCLAYLQQSKKISNKTGFTNLGLIAKATEILLRLLLVSEHLKDLY